MGGPGRAATTLFLTPFIFCKENKARNVCHSEPFNLLVLAKAYVSTRPILLTLTSFPVFLRVQNGGFESLGQGCTPESRGIFCHVTHDTMSFLEVQVISSDWHPYLFLAIWNLYFKQDEDILSGKSPQNTHDCWNISLSRYVSAAPF